MGLQEYLEKLRQKPAREKDRIAIIATAIAFLIFFGIWLVSFSESDKQVAPDQSSSTINDQLGDLKNSIGQGKQSIQDLIQNPPQGGGPTNPGSNNQSGSSVNSSPSQDLNTNQNDQTVPSQNPNENKSVLPSNGEQKNSQDSQNPPQNNLPSGTSIPQLP
jgi:hypothetical protein